MDIQFIDKNDGNIEKYNVLTDIYKIGKSSLPIYYKLLDDMRTHARSIIYTIDDDLCTRTHYIAILYYMHVIMLYIAQDIPATVYTHTTPLQSHDILYAHI